MVNGMKLAFILLFVFLMISLLPFSAIAEAESGFILDQTYVSKNGRHDPL